MKKTKLTNREESKSFDHLEPNRAKRLEDSVAQSQSNSDKGIKKYFRVKRRARLAAEEMRLN